MLDIVIIGAGPAGLAAALRLHQQGFKPRLFEAVQEIKPLGVGVDIKPYAVKELTELGLYDAFCEISVEAQESIFIPATASRFSPNSAAVTWAMNMTSASYIAVICK